MSVRNALMACVILPAVFSTPAIAQQTASTAPAAGTLCDADCIRSNSETVAQMCARPIEAQAPIDFEWVNRPYASFFQEADPPEGQSSVVIYRGDSIRFVTPKKEWIRMTFECAYDANAKKLVGVRLKPGRLGQPQPVIASAAPAPPSSKAAQMKQPSQIDGAALGAAIQRAVRRPKPAAKPTRTMNIGEPSGIEVEQMAIAPD
ncbi:hypothetical protein [Rhizobium sp. AN80A]|uniref:hypothetical protein n=1 Tax=Rhizobium sp. AN80A TaxID=3040673 RepID=UPI0024B32293|nr:hypothetical protein [Rhizobium sp. AN80A]